MFNDERERQLFEMRATSPSIQSWAAELEEYGVRERESFRKRVLLGLGRRLMAVGSRLSRRFGSSADKPNDRVFNH